MWKLAKIILNKSSLCNSYRLISLLSFLAKTLWKAIHTLGDHTYHTIYHKQWSYNYFFIIHYLLPEQENIFFKFSRNFETDASEFLENHEMFPLYNIHSNVYDKSKSSTTLLVISYFIICQ